MTDDDLRRIGLHSDLAGQIAGEVLRLRADARAKDAEIARLRMILVAREAYERGEPSQPPLTGREKSTILSGPARVSGLPATPGERP
jgi:hypothetical protein